MLHAAVATIRTYLGLTSSEDAAIQAIADMVQSLMEEHCKRRLKAAARTFYADGGHIGLGDQPPRVALALDGSTSLNDLIQLPEPFASIASVKQDSSRVFAAGSLVSATTYALDGSGMLLRRLDNVWEPGLRNIEIIGQVGFATMPATLLMCEINEVSRRRNMQAAQRQGDDILKSQSTEGWSKTFRDDVNGLAEETKDILNRAYRNRGW